MINGYYMVNTATVKGNEFDSDLSNNTSTVITEVYGKPLESICIIVPKVYSSCKKRKCFKYLEISLPGKYLSFIGIQFQNGSISNENVTPLSHRPGYARVEFDMIIPYVLTYKDQHNELHMIQGNLPKFNLDIIHYYPETRSEISLTLYANTFSEILIPAHIYESTLTISVGSFIISYVALPVQLQIPSLGYCPEPIPCEEFPQFNPCAEFLNPMVTPFPTEFYPYQLDDCSL